jgi:hypothetical protein
MPDQLPSSAAPGRAPDEPQPPYYRPSGKVPRSAILVAPVCGLAVLPCAFLYAWLTVGAPAFVNIVALAIFALCIALAVERAALWARVRSHDWITRFGVALALCAWYAQWVAWVALALHRQQGGAVWRHAGDLVADPAALLAAVAYAARHDAWGAGAMPMAAIWLAEAFILLHFSRNRTAKRPTPGPRNDPLPVRLHALPILVHASSCSSNFRSSCRTCCCHWQVPPTVTTRPSRCIAAAAERPLPPSATAPPSAARTHARSGSSRRG